jgi:hypothetical protein
MTCYTSNALPDPIFELPIADRRKDNRHTGKHFLVVALRTYKCPWTNWDEEIQLHSRKSSSEILCKPLKVVSFLLHRVRALRDFAAFEVSFIELDVCVDLSLHRRLKGVQELSALFIFAKE